MTAFDQLVNQFETKHAAVQRCANLTDLQSIRIWQTEIDGYQHVGSLLAPAIQDEISLHPDFELGDAVRDTNPPLAKMHWEAAEVAITAEYAYRIYLAVKAVLDKGADLK